VLVFERLWEETGCRNVIADLAGARGHKFALERAVFLTVLHRLFVSGSDRAADRWREDYMFAGVEGLDLHHLYRATAWLTNVALHFRAQQPLDPSNINGLCHIPRSKCRVEERRGCLGHTATLRFLSSLIEPDRPSYGIRLSDKTSGLRTRETMSRDRSCTRPSVSWRYSYGKHRVPVLVFHRALPDLQRMKLCHSVAASSASRSVFAWCDKPAF